MAIIKKFRIKSFKNPKPMISLENISLSFGKRKILDNVSFKINNGEILGMLGPNGVGKSTIFNLITGLIKPNYGKIKFNETDVVNYPIYLRTTKFKIGYCPQFGGFFNDLTLLENLRSIAEIVIEDKNLINHKIDQLSFIEPHHLVTNIKDLRFENNNTRLQRFEMYELNPTSQFIIQNSIKDNYKLIPSHEMFTSYNLSTIDFSTRNLCVRI